MRPSIAFAQGLRQAVPGLVHVGEQSIAALLRQLLGAASSRGSAALIGKVGVPGSAGIAETDGLAVLDDVGNDEDLRMPWEQELLRHMDLQLTEAPAEGDLLRRG